MPRACRRLRKVCGRLPSGACPYSLCSSPGRRQWQSACSIRVDKMVDSQPNTARAEIRSSGQVDGSPVSQCSPGYPGTTGPRLNSRSLRLSFSAFSLFSFSAATFRDSLFPGVKKKSAGILIMSLKVRNFMSVYLYFFVCFIFCVCVSSIDSQERTHNH